MKKILALFISFFVIFPTCFARTLVNSISTEIDILESGEANVTSKFSISTKNESITFNLDQKNISDLSVKSDDEDIPYKFNKGKITIEIKKENFILAYKINKYVYKFKDGLGINDTLIDSGRDFNVKVADYYIKTYKPLTNVNANVKIIGKAKNVSFDRDMIKINAVNVKANSRIKVLVNILEIDYNNKININKTFDKVFQETKKIKFVDNIKSNIILITIVFVLLISGIVILIVKIIKMRKFDPYEAIIFKNIKSVKSTNEVPYCENVPLNGDLYKLLFVSSYLNINKNPSNIIGALILRWWFEGKLNLEDEGKYKLELFDNVSFNNKIDADLYDILKSASTKNVIEDQRLSSYAESNYCRVISWFNMAFKYAVDSEVESGLIKIVQKHKKAKVILPDSYADIANKIKGLKKYILNFNQVPRKTELDEEGYKYLLILSELLGIGESFANEILRKNPNNLMASKLLILENNKQIYKDIYKNVLTLYEKNTKRKKFKNNKYIKKI